MLADGVVLAVGQPVAVVVARSPEAAEALARATRVDIAPWAPIVGIDAAIAVE